MSNHKEENITFEQAIEELETIINRLEEGDVPLDETIKLYFVNSNNTINDLLYICVSVAQLVRAADS